MSNYYTIDFMDIQTEYQTNEGQLVSFDMQHIGWVHWYRDEAGARTFDIEDVETSILGCYIVNPDTQKSEKQSMQKANALFSMLFKEIDEDRQEKLFNKALGLKQPVKPTASQMIKALKLTEE